MPKRPCLICGAPTDGSRCSAHSRTGRAPKQTRRDTGATAWKALSNRARRAQPFCLLCGSPDRLQADHSPRAWARLAARKTLRLADVNVLCQSCNLSAGSSKPGSARYARWVLADDGDLAAKTPDPSLAETENRKTRNENPKTVGRGGRDEPTRVPGLDEKSDTYPQGVYRTPGRST